MMGYKMDVEKVRNIGTMQDLYVLLKTTLQHPKELKTQFNIWASNQSMLVEAAISTLTGSLQGAFMGGVMGTFLKADPSKLQKAAAQSGQSADILLKMNGQMGGAIIQARNFAVITGVHAGIATLVKRIRHKDDTYTAMSAAFGSGVCFSLVSGITQSNRLQGAFTTGVMFATFQGVIHKLGSKFSTSKTPPNNVDYAQATAILGYLGFPEYGKNLQQGRLNDTTIWLWNDKALSDVHIPPGPRLTILKLVEENRDELAPPKHTMGSSKKGMSLVKL